jgi:hypothetical protein
MISKPFFLSRCAWGYYQKAAEPVAREELLVKSNGESDGDWVTTPN